jgi:hypothetical protein
MRTDGKTELQHYVPRLLLRRHAVDPTASKGSERVWCYDKSTDKVFQPNIKGITSGRGFYELEHEEGTWSLEASLTNLETKVSPILERIITKRALSGITQEDRFTVSAFLAVQFVRTQAARDYIRTLNRTVLSALIAKGIGPDQFEGMRALSDDEIKEMSLQTPRGGAYKLRSPFFLETLVLNKWRSKRPALSWGPSSGSREPFQQILVRSHGSGVARNLHLFTTLSNALLGSIRPFCVSAASGNARPRSQDIQESYKTFGPALAVYEGDRARTSR